MLDFEAYRGERISFDALIEGLERGDLADLTHEMIDGILAQIESCHDEGVILQPFDPEADDPYAADEGERYMPWTLGHVIVHITASAEESAALAAEMARGVPFHGRSRFEVDWRSIATISACRERLQESRRMRIASLDTWPDVPHLEITYVAWQGAPEINAIGRFVLGLMHDADHLEQIDKIVKQAQEMRGSGNAV
jgi:hypothetical protein